MRQNAKRGFTLIELLVVIAIIGLLSTLAVVALNSARQKARDSKRVADMKQLQTALEIYFNDKSAYPTGDDELGAPGGSNFLCLGDTGWGSVAVPCSAGTIYMGLVPRDPNLVVDASPCRTAAGNCNYSYRLGKNGGGETGAYEIHFRLEANTGGLTVGLNCATEAGTGSSCAH